GDLALEGEQFASGWPFDAAAGGAQRTAWFQKVAGLLGRAPALCGAARVVEMHGDDLARPGGEETADGSANVGGVTAALHHDVRNRISSAGQWQGAESCDRLVLDQLVL